MKKLILPIVAVTFLLGCSSVETFDGVKRQPKAQIDVLVQGQTPSRPYKIIAEFSDEGDSGSEAKMHRRFVNDAKKIGADAVILKQATDGGFSFRGMRGGSKIVVGATAIVYETQK